MQLRLPRRSEGTFPHFARVRDIGALNAGRSLAEGARKPDRADLLMSGIASGEKKMSGN